jgi:hypothetical protein
MRPFLCRPAPKYGKKTERFISAVKLGATIAPDRIVVLSSKWPLARPTDGWHRREKLPRWNGEALPYALD